MGKYIVYIDGSGSPTNVISVHIFYQENNTKQFLLSEVVATENCTNNYNEFYALYFAISRLSKPEVKIHFYTDSQLVAKVMNKQWELSDPELKTLYLDITNEWDENLHTIKWIPREQNLAGKLIEFAKRKLISSPL